MKTYQVLRAVTYATLFVTQLQGQIEYTQTVAGRVQVLTSDDFQNHQSKLWHELRDETNGCTLRMHPAKPNQLNALFTDERVRLCGSIRDNELTALSEPEHLQAAPPTESAEPLKPLTPDGFAAAAQDHSVLVIAVNFRDVALTCQPGAIAEMLFTGEQSVNALYNESTYGSVGFTGDVVGPFTIDFDSKTGTCSPYLWARAAETAARAAGVPVNQYRHKVYVLPWSTPCSWSGLATVGGNPSQAWIKDCDSPGVYAHELGHNLGLRHASSDYNNNGAKDCEYCDNSDIMGYAGVGLRQLNAPHKDQLGLLPAGKIVTPANETNVKLAPLEFAPDQTPHPQIIKIPEPVTGRTYYFSYRRPIGFDTNLLTDYRNTLSVHHYAGGDRCSYLVTTLTDGDSFIDPSSGLTVTFVTHQSDFALVRVTYDCYHSAPTITYDSASLVAMTGTTTSTTITVTNHDSRVCTPTVFQLTATAPRKWIVALNPATLTLEPGQFGITHLSVTFPPKLLRRNKPITISVADNLDRTHSATSSLTFVRETVPISSDLIPPGPPTKLHASIHRRKVLLQWDAATDNIDVAGYVIWRDNVLLGQTKHHWYSDRAFKFSANHSYSVVAFDAAGNESSPATVAITEVTSPAGW